jgi:hypothetical protein
MALDQDCTEAQHENVNERLDVTPLPWGQLMVVSLIQFAEPVTAAVIYPFINQFVQTTGVTGGNEEKTGYFAGMIVRTWFYDLRPYNPRGDIPGIHFLLGRGCDCCILGHGV